MGYATGQFGRDHLGDLNEFLPTVHGFDELFGAARPGSLRRAMDGTRVGEQIGAAIGIAAGIVGAPSVKSDRPRASERRRAAQPASIDASGVTVRACSKGA